MFDETDVSCKSQHSVYIGYVNRGNIFEDFVGFIDLWNKLLTKWEKKKQLNLW
jgi:hypothetical protein